MDVMQKIELLLDRLGHLHRSYQRDFAYSEGLNLRQLEVLLFLANCNKYSNTPLALSEYLGLTKGTVSQTIISLERKKLLKKKRDSTDGRVVHLHLTPKGRALVKDCVDGSDRATALHRSKSDFAQLQEGLEALLKDIQHANGCRTFGACHTCKFFQPKAIGQHHRCGLTLEPLYSKDSLKICREHTDLISMSR